jgi:hypothetical protein
MGVNMYLTLYRCIRDHFKYQYLIATIGYQDSIHGDRKENSGRSNSIKGIEIENDATSDIMGMLICCN